jgi:hypothetical protein
LTRFFAAAKITVSSVRLTRNHTTSQGDGIPFMRERNREINQRRQRQEKRKKLRKRLAAASDDASRRAIEEKIRKTYPKAVLAE